MVLPSVIALAPGATWTDASGMLATAGPVFCPLSFSAKISVATLACALSLEWLSTVTFKLTVADAAEASGVVT